LRQVCPRGIFICLRTSVHSKVAYVHLLIICNTQIEVEIWKTISLQNHIQRHSKERLSSVVECKYKYENESRSLKSKKEIPTTN